MAQHLTEQNIEDIVELLDYWDIEQKLTWDKLCKAIEVELNFRPAPTRQTLQKYVRIKNAYNSFKKSPSTLRVRSSQKEKLPASLKIAQSKIESLEVKIKRLEQENSQLLQQFVIWQYNAHKYGITMDKLNESLAKKQ
ncbi:hypothetical protein [Acinetobacter baumannii]|uniref:hypothetical protein n=1 Tax=Acinetobacter baumannii TaxID=470 RepID=UPI003AF5DF87